MPVYLILENTVFTSAQLPDCAETQIALAGRSNVGKSSLLNALAGRKNLAKVSATPGKTRSINFFRAMPWNFYLVDLPGYGYARASHRERDNWAKLLERYLTKTKNLRALVLLLDCRLPPQKNDMELTRFAGASRFSLLPVLTKTDKCNRRER
ncbi:MAG: ribosome biogenesis GTP-binding protein YihA/YsxC, partial [Desulfovibrio sp.]|nr:ribosome biogenesis GTP-binding protein YihA/YsxC [Desulfovibrio sp.]